MSYDEENAQKITRDSLEACKNELYRLHGRDYRIIDKQVEFVPCGLFKLRTKAMTTVTYVLNHPKVYNADNYFVDKQREEEQLEKNRDAIITNQNAALMKATINQLNNTIEKFQSEMSEKLSKVTSTPSDKHESIKKIEEMLADNDFSLSFINMITDKIRNEFSLDQLDDFTLVERRVVDWIGESISIMKDKVHRPPHVYILVGPTGVGKTTTLVKLAVQFIKNFDGNGRKAEICFISADTMRVGAMEQLSRWCELMKYTVLKADRPGDVQTLYEQNRDRMDAIFIDTSGFSPNDATHIAKMKMLLEVPGMNPDIYLAVAASTKTRDLHNIIQNYEPFGFNSVIITKCDESLQFGNVLSVIYERHKNLSYITNGQHVAACISKASVVDFLIRLEGFKIDRVHIEDKFGEQ